MTTLLTPVKKATEKAPDGMYWVFTQRGANALDKDAGAVIGNNAYVAPSDWVREGYVTPEELE